MREFETPSRKRDSDPTHLGKNWAATPLPLRLSFAERDRRAAEQQASRDLNVINGIWFKRIVEFDLEGPHGGLLTDLVEAATADDALLSTIPKDEFFSIIDEIILALPEEDHPAMHGIVFGYEGNGKDDIEQHTIGQLQEICIVLVEELVLVDGELRLVTDDSVF